MSPTTKRRRRSWRMQLLRLSPGPVFLLLIAGGVLTLVGAVGNGYGHIRDIGAALLALGGCLFVTVLWGGVYLNVVEASRGHPGLRPVDEPALAPEPVAKYAALKRSLTELGFRPREWFKLDDFDETHIGAWTHDAHAAAAFVMYIPAAGAFRLRFVRKFPNGGVLITSTRLTDVSYEPPQGMYLQLRPKCSVEELWAWHREAESLFPPDATEGASRAAPRELFVEVAARWSGHRRRDRTWLLAVEPVEECWRMYWLAGMPLREQFERGWTTPFWQ